jgi:hypothetical protein
VGVQLTAMERSPAEGREGGGERKAGA